MRRGDTKLTELGQCEVQVPDGGRMVTFHRCTNRAMAEAGGKKLCGTHLRALRNRQRQHEEFDERVTADEAYKERVEALASASGINAQPYFSRLSRRYEHGQVVVPIEVLKRLAEEKERDDD